MREKTVPNALSVNEQIRRQRNRFYVKSIPFLEFFGLAFDSEDCMTRHPLGGEK
jgi:hypothetical protein